MEEVETFKKQIQFEIEFQNFKLSDFLKTESLKLKFLILLYISSVWVVVLFDYGSSHSFISPIFV